MLQKITLSLYIAVILFGCKAPDTLKSEADAWVSKSNTPFLGRHHPVAFTLNNLGYIGLGTNGVNPLSDFFRYDPTTDLWQELTKFPGGPRGYAVGLTYNGKAYVGFGTDAKDFNRDLWEYTPATDAWKRLTDCPCEGREHPAFVSLNGKVYVGMGGNATGNLGDWWAYDIAENTWKEMAPLPGNARHHPFYFAVNGRVYVGLGHGSTQVNGTLIYKDFFEYNPVINQWKQLQDFPGEERVGGSQFDYNGAGYIISGQGRTHQSLARGEFWRYNSQTDTWQELEAHPNKGRWAPGTFIISNRLYLFGGQLINDQNDLYTYKFP